MSIKFTLNRLVKASLCLVLACMTTESHAHTLQPTCPGDDPHNRSLIEYVLTSADFQEDRANLNIPETAINSLRVLGSTGIIIAEPSGPSDSVACAHFKDLYDFDFVSPQNPDPRRQPVFYQAGNFYFVVRVIRPSIELDTIRAGLSYVIIFDSNLNRLKGYAVG